MGGRSGSPDIVDEFTREALATTAARSFTTVLLDKIIAETGRRPARLRMDNGSEPTAATGHLQYAMPVAVSSHGLIESKTCSRQRSQPSRRASSPDSPSITLLSRTTLPLCGTAGAA